LSLRVLFVCLHNSGRSQMAEAFFNRLAGDRATASSAGTQPAAGINPAVVEVMREEGIEIGNRRPKLLTTEMIQNADRVISMGCGVAEACPAGFIVTEDWGIDDPQGRPLAEVRRIRDEIKSRVAALMADL
jgi:arsenate reductase